VTESKRPDGKPEPTTVESAKAIARSSYLNVLLVFIPVSWAIHYAKPQEDELIFVCEFSTHTLGHCLH
jgi:Ca2+:H+ antiporter